MADEPTIAMPPVILLKPKYGTPCNGCGFCCHEEICAIGQKTFPEAVAPCPALTWQDGRYWCGLMLAEQELIREHPEKKPLIQEWLAAGWGCDSRSYDIETGELVIP